MASSIRSDQLFSVAGVVALITGGGSGSSLYPPRSAPSSVAAHPLSYYHAADLENPFADHGIGA